MFVKWWTPFKQEFSHTFLGECEQWKFRFSKKLPFELAIVRFVRVKSTYFEYFIIGRSFSSARFFFFFVLLTKIVFFGTSMQIWCFLEWISSISHCLSNIIQNKQTFAIECCKWASILFERLIELIRVAITL